MRILITGGAGFIGHNVTRILEGQGHSCVVLDNFTNYGFVPPAEMKYLSDHRMRRFQSEVIHGHIQHTNHVNIIFQEHNFDTVIHLASFPRQKVVQQDPALASIVMSTGLINLLEGAKNAQVEKFVYISSSMVYGDFTEDNLHETAPTNPIGQYGIMKLAGEWLVKDYARQTGMNYTIIRPSAVYGEWDVDDRVVSKFMTQAMRGETLKVNGANEVLDFTYVEDTAMGIAQATQNSNANNKIYNITRSNPKEYTLLDAAKLAISIAGKGDIQEQGRDLSFPKRGRLSIDAAQADFNYNPTVDVEEGFNRYYAWYLKNPVLY